MPHILKGVRNIMGTFVSITVVHPDKDEGTAALSAAFREISNVNDLMSIYRENSEVSILNRKGYYHGLSTDTRYVIQKAEHFAELTGGTFDITVLPLLKLQEERAHTGRIPTDAEISEKLGLVNHRNIELENDNIKLKKPGMGITLGGIAKGYAIDKAIETLRKHSVKHALVNAGGDIRVIGGKTRSTPWRIAVRNPTPKTKTITKFEVYDKAIATSGTYQRPFSDIMNPRAGIPSREVISSTITADTAIDADILATCVYILGAEKGKELLNKLHGVEAMVIIDNGDTLKLA